MKYSLFYLLLILFSSLFCNSSNNERTWEQYFIELPQKKYSSNIISDMYFNNKIGILVGEEASTGLDGKFSQKPLFTYNHDLDNSKWMSQIYTRGSFKKIKYFENSYYYIHEIYSENNQISSLLLKKSDQNDTLFSFSGFIRNFFIDKDIIYFEGCLYNDAIKDSYRFYKYDVIEKKISKVFEENLIQHNSYFDSGKLFIISSESSPQRLGNRALIYSIQNKTFSKIKFPDNYNCYFLGNYLINGKSCVIAVGRKTDETLTIYKIDENGSYSTMAAVKEFQSKGSIFPKNCYVDDNHIFIIVGERFGTLVENKLIYSNDGGEKWHEENFPDSQMCQVSYFYKNDLTGKVTLWIYKGAGYLQKKTFF